MTSIDNGHPIFAACASGNVEAVREHLAQGIPADAESEIDAPLISTAIALGDTSMAELLLQSGLEPNQPYNRFNETPLVYAVQRKNLEIVDLLLAHGADVNATNQFQMSVLHSAAGGGNVEVLKRILQADPELQVTDRQGNTPLHSAARENHVETMDLLFAHGLKTWINTQNSAGETPLHLVAKKGHADACQWLLERDADPEITDRFEKTPLVWASSNGHVQVATLLRRGS